MRLNLVRKTPAELEGGQLVATATLSQSVATLNIVHTLIENVRFLKGRFRGQLLILYIVTTLKCKPTIYHTLVAYPIKSTFSYMN